MLRVKKGNFGFVGVFKASMSGTERLVCEMTVRDHRVTCKLNGVPRESWDRLRETSVAGRRTLPRQLRRSKTVPAFVKQPRRAKEITVTDSEDRIASG
jgi:hypothetical protein